MSKQKKGKIKKERHSPKKPLQHRIAIIGLVVMVLLLVVLQFASLA